MQRDPPDPPDRAAGEPLLAVLVRFWPRLSDTAVLEEVLGLERQGWRIVIYALEPADGGLRHGAVERVRAPVQVVPSLHRAEAPALLARHLALLWADPGAWLQGLAGAIRRGRGGLGDFLRGGWVAVQLKRDAGARLHHHGLGASADLAALAARLARRPLSLAAADEDLQRCPPADLRRRIAAARFVVASHRAAVGVLQGIAPQARVLCLHPGVDHRVFHPLRRETRDDGPPLLLAVGRLRARKGFDVLIEACALLRARGRTVRCEIVGDGAEWRHLEASIAERGLTHQVALVGRMSREQLISRYARAALYVQPSRIAADGDRDGIPIALLEALAMALPVVASHVSGIPEVIGHQRHGLLVEPDNAAALAEAIAWLLDRPQQAQELGRAGRAGIVEAFDSDRNLRALAELLRHPARRGPRAAPGTHPSAPCA